MNIRRYQKVSTAERCHRWCNFTRPPMLIYSPVWFICRTNWKINILIGQITCQLNSWQRVNWGPITLQFSIHWILFIGIQMWENGYLDQRRHAVQSEGARNPSNFWAKWILNAVSKRQNISKYFFYIWSNHTGVIGSFSAAQHQMLNENLCSCFSWRWARYSAAL